MNRNMYIVVAVAFVLIALGVWYMFGRAPAELPAEGVEAEASSVTAEQLGGALLEKAQNPLKDELPQTNPFTGAETNPFIDVYENPFAPR